MGRNHFPCSRRRGIHYRKAIQDGRRIKKPKGPPIINELSGLDVIDDLIVPPEVGFGL
jgi:hypothetical protein